MNGGAARIELPRRPVPALEAILRRLAFALALVVAVAMIAYVERDGYVDADGSGVSLLDCFYYATVSITTTGYGDVRPESDAARLMTTLLVTPLRLLFLIVLVGTTVELLAERTRQAVLVSRWRARMRDHVIICGYGSKGRSAARTLLAKGHEPAQITVIDDDPNARDQARAMGFATVAGSATSTTTLDAAGIAHARSVVVAPNRDDTSVLITLTARELNRDATIVAAVREEENVHLLHQSGADSVITSSGAAGRLLGLATREPRVVEVLEDLLSVGKGLDLIQRELRSEEIGPLADLDASAPVIAVVRDGTLLRFDDPRAEQLQPGDHVVCLCSHAEPHDGGARRAPR